MWGFLPIGIKVAVQQVDPVTIVWFRFFVAFIILCLYFLFTEPANVLRILKSPGSYFLGAVALAANYTGYAIGIDYTSPGNAQVFIQLGPVLLAIAGVVLFKEKLTWRQFSGFGITTVGFYLFFSDQTGKLIELNKEYVTGVIWIVFAAAAWAVYGVVQKKMVADRHPQQLNFFVFGFSSLLLSPFANYSNLGTLSINYVLLLVLLGMVTMAAYGAMAMALKYAEASKVSILFTLNPIITFIAMSFLAHFRIEWIRHENISALGFSGAGLVLIGAAFVILKSKK